MNIKAVKEIYTCIDLVVIGCFANLFPLRCFMLGGLNSWVGGEYVQKLVNGRSC